MSGESGDGAPGDGPAAPEHFTGGETTDSVHGPRYFAMWELVRARLIEFWREPAAIFWVYVFPLIMVVALGIAFRNRPIESATAVVQEGPAAEQIAAELNGSGRFDAEVVDEAESVRRLRVGQADLLIVAEGPTGESGGITYRFDPTRPASQLARNSADDVLQRAAGRVDMIATQDSEFSEPGGRYIDFLIPGLLGMGLMGGGLWGVGFAIVDMRIRKLLKRYLATPMKRSHFLAAIMTSRLLFTIPEIVVLLIFARVLFGVTNQGSYVTLTGLILLGAVEFAGVGLLVASRAQTLETVSGLMNAVMLPLWLGSGIFFSVDRFPDALQPVIALLPLTPLISAMRQVMLEGASVLTLGPELAIMAVWAVATFSLGLRLFRWS